MLFNSLPFLIFFPVVLAVHFALPARARWVWLLVASAYFYMAFIPAYVLILFFLIAVDYVAGIAIDGSQGARRKAFLVLSLVANCSILGFFKYYNFLAANVTALSHALGGGITAPVLGIVLPIGLSFHTFQSMSYTIEVYLGRQKAERHLGIYALYVLFWPQLVAGPIERPQNLLHQFREPRGFDAERARSGAELMLGGFVKKVLIADTLAPMVNAVYDAPEGASGLSLLVATYFFSFQIYCDFSGYTDIARGAARILGYELMVNFDRPYASASVSEFWRRWHISLSTWFRDYLYLPLGGNRRSRARVCFNLLVVFLVSGLWHGANWTFVVWGALHGAFLVAGLLARGRARGRAAETGLGRALGVLVTFNLVTLAWVFFRADTVGRAVYILGHLLSTGRDGSWAALPQGAPRVALGLALIVALNVIEAIRQPRPAEAAPAPVEPPPARGFFVRSARYVVVLGLAAAILLRLTDSDRPQQFIYFQF